MTMTTKPSPLRRFMGNYLILTGGLIAILGAAGEWIGLLNALAASLGALAVAGGSFIGYRNLVKNAPPPPEDRDLLDRIDDPHELYDESDPGHDEQRTTEAILKEEKARLKATKVPLNERMRLLSGTFSPLRILGYLLLVVAFFTLEGFGLFLPLFFIGGILILPLTAMMLLWQNRKVS